ncbi:MULTISPECIES: hypothetical protein [unclassified Luteococcus]|uniref:hypothetical protein n=1 Tax=unclassified Luteococcus TaxID=2639923 RepID=UPI00313F2270
MRSSQGIAQSPNGYERRAARRRKQLQDERKARRAREEAARSHAVVMTTTPAINGTQWQWHCNDCHIGGYGNDCTAEEVSAAAALHRLRHGGHSDKGAQMALNQALKPLADEWRSLLS